MAELLVKSEQPREIGELIAAEFENGAPYVHVQGVPILNHHGGRESAENPDGFLEHRRHERNKNMLMICEQLGRFESDSVDPSSFIEINDKNLPPNKPYHTAEASQPDAAKIVSYWGAQPRTSAGETIKIVPLDRLVAWAKKKTEREELFDKLKDSRFFNHEGVLYAPIVDEEHTRIRFDIKAFDPVTLPEQINNFFTLLREDKEVADEVRLKSGDALFIDNHRTLHSMRPGVNPSRLLYRILLYDRILGGEDYVAQRSCDNERCKSRVKKEWWQKMHGSVS